MENEKNLFTPKIEEIEKKLLQLEKKLSKLKKHYDYDNIEYRGIRDASNLFDPLIDEDFYKPIRISSAFKDDYIEYESKGDKKKHYQLKIILMKLNHN